jgi:signal transduction histidine kinase
MLNRISALVNDVRRVTAYVAHDLRIPLTALADDLRGSTDRCVTGDECAATLARAAAATDRLIELFNVILEIGEINPLRVQENGKRFDLSALVETLAGAHIEVAEDGGQRLRCSVQPDILLFGIDDLLAQALINLIRNALTHTPAGTDIVVALKSSGTTAFLAVSDDGPGLIDAERILTDDTPSASSAGPTRNALGLKLVSAIAAAHRGTLTIENARPGIRATLALPIDRETSA